MLMLHSLEVSQVLCLDTFKSHHMVEVLRKQMCVFLKLLDVLTGFVVCLEYLRNLGDRPLFEAGVTVAC